MTDLTQATAAELFRLYQAGTVSPVTVTEQVLDKIKRLNPKLNAFSFTDPDTTLAQAQHSEHRWQTGQPLSALDGVPIAFKDSILTKGWPTLYGSFATDPAQSWSEDAPAVARLREAGAVFTGKTTMSEFGSSSNDSDSLLYGKVYNPWNLECSPGGSSGGSAVAVAAGLVTIALGTDFGGSIAVPSTFCGVFGMKPSAGRIPQYPIDALELSTVGPLARSTADIALIMDVITKPDVRDGTSLVYDHTRYDSMIDYSLRGKKIACVRSMNNNQIATEILDYLASQGAQVDFISLDIESAEKIFKKLAMPKMLQQWLSIPDQLRKLTSRGVQRRALLAHATEDTYSQLNKRHALITHMREFMQSYDVVIGPATTTDSSRQTTVVENISPLSVFFSITKQPTVTVPIGLDHNGMPISVMIAGSMHDDIEVLQVAHAIEKQFPMPACPVIL